MNINRFYPLPKVLTEPSEFGLRRTHSCSAYAVSMIIASYGLLIIGLLGSCSENFQVDPQFSDPRDAIVRFQINTDTPKDITTRAVNEDKINDLHVLVYNSAGDLTGKSYNTFSGTTYTISVSTRSGTGCKIYVIANTGNPALFDGSVANSEAKLKAMTTNLATWSTFNNTSGTVYLPMSGSITTNISPGTTSLQSGITITRLVAKVSLNVGIASGSGVTISGYRIYGIPGRSYYVAHPLSTEDQTTDTQTTRADDGCLPANGGDWINSGLASLSDVTAFSTDFYTYENRVGVNVAITAQNQKIKANVPANPADSAAYIMIYGKAPGYNSLSWKIYLGANNTSNFNLKRNGMYSCTIKLKPNSSDMRIDYTPKVIWAGSNIYWDGTKLTFDSAPIDPLNPTTQELVNMKKQGVFFKWGSLVGISPSGVDGNPYDSSVSIYTPIYQSVSPLSSTWQIKNGGVMSWGALPGFADEVNGGQSDTFLNAAAQNSDANYIAYKGDICKYLSKTGAVTGNWRMPTMKDFNPTNLGDNGTILWTTSTATWRKFGVFGSTSGSADGQSIIDFGGTIIIDGGGTNFPTSGYRYYSDGRLINVGLFGNYWSCSAYVSGNTYAYFLNFHSDYIAPSHYDIRQYGFPVRCIRD